MKKILFRILFFSFIVFICADNLKAQFSISGEFRMRGEYREGYMSLRDSSKTPYADILGRARLVFDFNSEKIMTRFSLNDAWVYGQNNYSSDTISKNTVNIFEAFLKYNFTKSFALKVGRSELVYDDERFLGASNWSMWGATHDIVLSQWETPGAKYKGDFGFAVNNIAPTSPYLSSYLLKNYKYMGFLWEQKKFFRDKFIISFLGLVDAFQKPGLTSVTKTITYDTLMVKDTTGNVIGYTVTKDSVSTSKTTDYPSQLYARATAGLNFLVNLKKWSFFLTGYYQWGHYKDGRKINSHFYSAWVSYQVIKALKLQIGFDHLSGNNFSKTTTLKTTVKGFSTLYGTAHRAYGYMDLFNTLVKDNLSTGLNDLYLRGTVSLDEKTSVEGTWRWFSIPYGYLSRIPAPNSRELPYMSVDKSLGHELDVMFVYKPLANLELNAAYCLFLPTSSMELMSNIASGKSKFANYAYLMITYKPNFFISGK